MVKEAYFCFITFMNHSNHGDSKMMWLMMAGCLLFPALIWFTGGGGRLGGGSWVWLIPAIIFIAIHLVMMIRHSVHGTRKEDERPKSGSDTKGDSGCCH